MLFPVKNGNSRSISSSRGIFNEFSVRNGYVYPAGNLVTGSSHFDRAIDPVSLRLRGKSTEIPIRHLNPETDLVVPGFPRSGNTFLTDLLNQVKKPQTRVIDGKVSHRASDVIRCAKSGVTTLIPVREPVDTCASWMVRTNQPHSQSQAIKTLKAYTAWYQTAATQLARDSVMTVPFEDIVKNPLFLTARPELNQFLDLVQCRNMNRHE